MSPQMNWTKIVNELNKLTDVEHLKSEVQRISQEIRKFDINEHLSPKAKERLKVVEQKYQDINKRIHSTQRQVDREFNKVIRNLKTQRSKAEKSFDFVKKAAQVQRKKIEKASDDIRTRVLKATGKKKKTKTKRKTTRKKSAAHNPVATN